MKKYKVCVYAIYENEGKFEEYWMESIKEVLQPEKGAIQIPSISPILTESISGLAHFTVDTVTATVSLGNFTD